MNGTFSPAQLSSDVYGIVGTGISLGVLAGTTGMIMRSMERNVYDRPMERSRGYGRRPYSREEEDEEDEYYRRPKRTSSRKSTSSKKRKSTSSRRPRYEEDEYTGDRSPWGNPMNYWTNSRW